MNAARGWYSVIQYCPNPSRAEAANVGVLLACPEKNFIRAVTSRGNDRIRRFFKKELAPQEIERINAAKRSIERRVENEAPYLRGLRDLERFIHSRAHSLVMTNPRELRVNDPESELRALYQELVGGRGMHRQEQQRPETLIYLDQAFSRLKHEGREIHFNVSVPVPVINVPFRAPYTYQNGAFCIVCTIVPHESANATASQALKLASIGKLIKGRSDQPSRLIVASSLDGEEKLESRLQAVFRDHETDFFNSNRIPELVEKVEHEAK